MKIYIFRHGTTPSNEKKHYTGFQDVSISENGAKELHHIYETKVLPDVDFIISSPMKRCIETMAILYPNRKADVFYADLKETNFGDWEGKSYDNLKNDPNYVAWINDFENVLPPNGESYNYFNKRVCDCFTHIVENYSNYDNLLIMCHGGVIRSIMSNIIDPSKNFFEWHIPNGLGYELEYIDGKFTYRQYTGV